MDKNTNEFAGNGWTQYQKLVLAELERHDDKQEDFQKKLLELQLILARLETQLAQIHSSITNLSADNKALDKARETHNIDLKGIQGKITGFSMLFSGMLAIVIEIVINFFKK